jgi:tRNA(Ile)-lysidine synthase
LIDFISYAKECLVAVLPPLIRKVRRGLRRLDVTTGGIVVAVSGGPDSVALLRILATLRRGDGLTVAHLNHQLRGAESDDDEAFVQGLAAKLSLPIHSERLDVKLLTRQLGDNLEAVARRARYAWFARVAQQTAARWVATGHTADDQAETVLHRLLRGTGLKGLRGVAARRELTAGIGLVRPLLPIRRTEVLAYLDAEGQDYRIDSSNRDPAFTRNRIRHELLPLLAERFNPEIVSILGRLAGQVDEVYRLELEQARALLAAAERPRAGGVLILDREQLAGAARHQVREVFRLLWEREGWPQGRMSFAAWDRLADIARGDLASVDLPGGIHVAGRERVVQIGTRP